MSSKLSLFFLIVLLTTLVLPVNTQAQDNDGLSEEELGWLERYLETPTIVNNYEQYAFELARSQDIRFTLTIFEQSLEIENLEYLAMNGEVDNLAEQGHMNMTVDLYHDEIDADVGYTLDGEAIISGEVLYARGEYSETLGDVPAIPEDWQVLEQLTDIPDEFSTMGLDMLFEGNLGFIPVRELLVQTASRVIYEENTLPDGTPVEIVSILVEDQNFITLLDAIWETEDSSDEFLNLIAQTEQYEGYVDIWVAFDSAGHVVYTENFIQVTAENIDFEALGMTDLPEGTTVNITMDILLATSFYDFNMPINMIEIPEVN